MRQMYLDALGDCEQRLQVELAPHQAHVLAEETAQLTRDCERQRTRRVGVRRRTAQPSIVAAD